MGCACLLGCYMGATGYFCSNARPGCAPYRVVHGFHAVRGVSDAPAVKSAPWLTLHGTVCPNAADNPPTKALLYPPFGRWSYPWGHYNSYGRARDGSRLFWYFFFIDRFVWCLPCPRTLLKSVFVSNPAPRFNTLARLFFFSPLKEVRNLMEYSTGFGVLSTNSRTLEG